MRGLISTSNTTYLSYTARVLSANSANTSLRLRKAFFHCYETLSVSLSFHHSNLFLNDINKGDNNTNPTQITAYIETYSVVKKIFNEVTVFITKGGSRRLEKSHKVWMMMMIVASLMWAGAAEKTD